LEAIWNKNANPVSSNYAIQAISLIAENYKRIKIGMDNIELRSTLLHASNLSGLAFSNTKTAAAHSISYPLTAHFGIPHGIAASMPLVPLLIINSHKIEALLESIYGRLSINCFRDLEEIIEDIPRPELKFRLRDWNVKHKDIQWLIEQCFTKGRMENNIVDLTKAHLEWIFDEIY
jgi:alcohol dehydrogenase class IV